MEGEILASSSVNIDANGDVYYKKISSENNADLKSGGMIKSVDSASVISAPNLTILSNSDINITAKSLSNKNTDNVLDSSGNAINPTLASLSKSLTLSLSGNLQNDGEISAATILKVNSGGELNNQGKILANNLVDIVANFFSNGSENNSKFVSTKFRRDHGQAGSEHYYTTTDQ